VTGLAVVGSRGRCASARLEAIIKLLVPLALIMCALVGRSVHARVPIGFASQADAESADRVTVPFVAIRTIEQDRKGFRYYGSARGELSAGVCTVDLDAKTNRQIVELQQRALDDVLDRFFTSSSRVTVYVHGYNAGFDESCRDAALLQERIGLEHPLLFFSWPAEGKMMGYLRDVGDLAWSVAPLRDLLVTLTDRFGSQNVDLIGHSLGAKGVVDAVTASSDILGARDLGRVVLIAPDIDNDVFIRDFAELRAVASSITIYVSSEDRALKASRNLRDEPRLGESVVGLAELADVDVVVVMQGFWGRGSGHVYHLRSRAVAEDLREVLSGPPHNAGWRMVDAGR
jgi:pimeloyl-ACP methyl ester carboxylesterase